MAKQRFIAKAIKRPGALTRRARRAGQSVATFARKHLHAPGLAGEESRFYVEVLAPRRRRRRRR